MEDIWVSDTAKLQKNLFKISMLTETAVAQLVPLHLEFCQRYPMGLLFLIFLNIFFPASGKLSQCSSITRSIVMEDEALIIKCPCTNQDDVSENITWFSNDRMISNKEEMRIYSYGEYLRILPTAQEDTGTYICLIQRDSEASSFCCHVNLTVYRYEQGNCFPPKPAFGPLTQTTGAAKIVCPMTDYYEKPSNFTWYKVIKTTRNDCIPLQGTKYSNISKVLIIKEANKNDEGNYTCKFTYVHNGTKYNVTRTKQLKIRANTVTILPMIESPRSGTMEVKLGSATNITCSAFLGYGHQMEAFISWKVNETEIKKLDPLRFHERKQSFQKSNNETFGVSVLTIMEVKEEDLYTNFTCTALNSVGWQTSTIVLIPPANDYRKHVLISFTGLLISIVFMITLYIYCRVDIVLLYREIFKPVKIADDGKVYDAYVVFPRKYNTTGMKTVEYFVHNILLDVLENKCGYNLYIPGRNTLPGEDIASAAEMNIKKSRRLIIILTSQIVNCEEFAYEQQIGLYDALIENNLKVILIEMEKISGDCNLQESLRHIIKQKGAIKWNEDIMANNHSPNNKFWKYVRYRMPGRINSPNL
ncbi:interleukin-1 receptor-like 1 [Microcaecilia unicolor]|uniref:Interleukin-1 receptor-like 1 n=1 Tax=Microcaecilia unicolor TaxID=1415580 RepID=A0A6P7Y0K0_9AMPH|nr:interleukin-1 receptor-like 1 [Microcaecilia unicolor]